MADQSETYGRDGSDEAMALGVPDLADLYLAELENAVRQRSDSAPCEVRDARLQSLTGLSSVPIETSMVADLSGTLHTLFDDVCDKTLPIYFGPLLGRLYLEGL